MVLGEPQILGQMKNAFALAQEAGSIGPKLGRLLPTVFAVTKQVRTDTAIGANPVSLAYAALRIAKRIFTQIKTCNLLCIGSGDMAKLVALYLHEHGIKQITLVGRSADKMQDLAKRIGAHCIGFRDIPSYLHETDIIVSATASQVPILGKGAIESALKGRKHRPILMFDMALPRDIEAEISELEDVYLYNLDDLQEVVKEGYQSREQAATQAEVIINQRAAAFMCELMAQGAVTLIRDLREDAEKICGAELQKAQNALRQGITVDKVLESLVRQLGNKLMHKPTLQLRQLAYTGQADLLKLLKDL
jgi:glutamyl-tRNA reductase